MNMIRRTSAWIFVAVLVKGLLAQTSTDITKFIPKNAEETLPCSIERSFVTCTWKLSNGTDIADYAFMDEPNAQEKAYLLQADKVTGVCNLFIKKAEVVKDNTTFICSIKVTSTEIYRTNYEVIVTVEPNQPELHFENRLLSSGERVEIKANANNPDDPNDAVFRCISRSGNPAASIVWSLYDSQVMAQSQQNITIEEDPATKLQTITSIFKFPIAMSQRYNGPDIYAAPQESNVQGKVQCQVSHPTYDNVPKELYAYIGHSSETKTVTLKITEGTTLPVTVLCDADGFPEPQFRIEVKENPDTDQWSLVANSKTATIDKDGEYRCSASNANPDSWVPSNSLKIPASTDKPEKSGEPEASSAEIGVVIGIVVGALVVLALICGITFYTFRSKRLCFAEHSSVTTNNGVESGVTAPNMYNMEKADGVKGDQNDNTKAKEIVYAQLNLAQQPPNQGMTNGSPKPEHDKTEYAQIKFQPKENQV